MPADTSFQVSSRFGQLVTGFTSFGKPCCLPKIAPFRAAEAQANVSLFHQAEILLRLVG
jgi:hypothetical protein